MSSLSWTRDTAPTAFEDIGGCKARYGRKGGVNCDDSVAKKVRVRVK